MDELSPDEARGIAAAANLRLAFGAPMGGDPPAALASLLDRLRGVSAPPVPPRGGAARAGAT